MVDAKRMSGYAAHPKTKFECGAVICGESVFVGVRKHVDLARTAQGRTIWGWPCNSDVNSRTEVVLEKPIFSFLAPKCLEKRFLVIHKDASASLVSCDLQQVETVVSEAMTLVKADFMVVRNTTLLVLLCKSDTHRLVIREIAEGIPLVSNIEVSPSTAMAVHERMNAVSLLGSGQIHIYDVTAAPFKRMTIEVEGAEALLGFASHIGVAKTSEVEVYDIKYGKRMVAHERPPGKLVGLTGTCAQLVACTFDQKAVLTSFELRLSEPTLAGSLGAKTRQQPSMIAVSLRGIAGQFATNWTREQNLLGSLERLETDEFEFQVKDYLQKHTLSEGLVECLVRQSVRRQSISVLQELVDRSLLRDRWIENDEGIIGILGVDYGLKVPDISAARLAAALERRLDGDWRKLIRYPASDVLLLPEISKWPRTSVDKIIVGITQWLGETLDFDDLMACVGWAVLVIDSRFSVLNEELARGLEAALGPWIPVFESTGALAGVLELLLRPSRPAQDEYIVESFI